MNSPIKIYCPTHKRSHMMKTTKIIGESLILCMVDADVEEYERTYPNYEIKVLPDNVLGNFSRIRNEIRDLADTDRFVMMDDDIDHFAYHEQRKRIKMDRGQIQEMLENGFDMAEDLGTPLWGINVSDAQQCYRQYSPFSFLTPVLGPFNCHVKDNGGIRYDDRLGLNEDFDYSLQVLKKFRKILRFNKYYYMCGHINTPGGTSSYRSMDREKAQAEIMIQKWGPNVVTYDMGRSPNPYLRCPLKGI